MPIQVKYVGDGHRLSTKEAGLVRKTLEQIRRTGPLTRNRVLDHARDQKSPLHRYFNWNDASEAEKRRLEVAGRLINAVEMIVRYTPQAKPKRIKAYVSISTPNKGRESVPMFQAMSQAQYRQQILQQAFNELAAFQRRYANYQELSQVFDAAEKAKRKLKIKIAA